jgi:hypothetical protein
MGKFMDLARMRTLREWRAAFLLVLCFQQLLRGAECFDLCGENVTPHNDFFRVEVMTAKNHPEGFGFKVPIDSSGKRPYCVGGFMEEFIKVMGIKLGVKESFFACKLTRVRGGKLAADSSAKVASSTMRNCCKSLITASGLDALEYATHSSKHRGTLEAMRAGLSDAQIQELGRWSSSCNKVTLRHYGRQ